MGQSRWRTFRAKMDESPAIVRYSIAVVCALAGLLASRAIHGSLEGVFFSLPVAVTALVAWAVGAGPGLLTATLIGVVMGVIGERPDSTLALTGSREIGQLVAYYLSACTVVVLFGLVERNRRALATAQSRAEQTLAGQECLVRSLQQADEQRQAFLGLLAHELRNPLTPVRNSVYLLERVVGGHEQADRALKIIDRQVTHMARMLDDLLDTTRIARGKIHLERDRADLNEVIRSVGDGFAAFLRANEIALDITVAEQALPVSVDRVRLAQALDNLLHHAAKSTAAGGRVHLAVEADDPDHAIVRVRDNGVGIEAQLMDRLFQPFAQVEMTRERSSSGLGLELALAKGLVELHGGELSAHSDGPGRGAEFRIRLPLETRTPAAQESRPGREGEAGKRASRILLIEDDYDTAESLKDALELNGHEVETASTGDEGIEKARTFHPDVVLCDIRLPGIDGFEVARRLRKDPALRSLSLIAVSGYAQPGDVEVSRAAGFQEHLAKPLSPADLEATLARVCARARPTPRMPA